MIENIPQEQLPVAQPAPPKIWLPFVVALIVVALVSGGGVYLWQQKEIRKLQSSEVTPTLKPTPVDSRTELSADGWNKKYQAEMKNGEDCTVFFETRFSLEPNTFVTYTSDKFMYSINFPYNNNWGDDENKVKPYEKNIYDDESIVMFGQPFFSEACSFFRTNLFELPKSTIDQTIQLINAENVKQNKENTSFPETASYKKITNLKYPVLEIETANAMFGSVKSAKIFLSNVTLEIANPENGLIEQLVNSIKTTVQVTSQDPRTLLTSTNAYSENTVKMGGMAGKACDEEFNQELANTIVTYKNVEKGLELSVPYNKNWGSKNYKINPYDEEKNGISFGEFTIGEGCSWLRNYNLSFNATRENIKMDNVKEYFLNGMSVSMWTEEGPGCWIVAEFVGIKSNYKFSFNGVCEDGKDLETLKMLASMIKQI